MRYKSKKKLRISNTLQLFVLGFLLVSFALGTMALMSGGFDLRQQAQVSPYCTGLNQCATNDKPCCSGLIPVTDFTCAIPSFHCVSSLPVVTPVPVGHCVSNTKQTSCTKIGYYPATNCHETCSTGTSCCGERIQNQVCTADTVICGPLTGGGFASAKCNDLGTLWVITPCGAGQVCSETTRLCVPGS